MHVETKATKGAAVPNYDTPLSQVTAGDTFWANSPPQQLFEKSQPFPEYTPPAGKSLCVKLDDGSIHLIDDTTMVHVDPMKVVSA